MVALVAIVVFAPGGDASRDGRGAERGRSRLTARMLAPTFDEALDASQKIRLSAKPSSLESQRKLLRLDPATTSVAGLFFLCLIFWGLVRTWPSIQLSGVRAGRFGPRSPPRLPLP